MSRLVPQHRLEDDKIRKQIIMRLSSPATTTTTTTNNNNMFTTMTGDEKDKGPNKGDVLNGAVGWMRDLMWSLHVKMQQESELAELITSLGGTWPFEQTEEEKRMRTEMLDAMDKNDPATFNYSRGPGSGLRVPKHTNVAGDQVVGGDQVLVLSPPQSLNSPFNGSYAGGGGGDGGGSSNSSNVGAPGPTHYSTSEFFFKEDPAAAVDVDEFSMVMN